MSYTITTATEKIDALKARIRALQGGTSAGKTIGSLQVLIDLAQTDEEPKLTSIISESLPHLKRGAMRDFLNIMETQRYFEEKRWNRSDFIYTFEGGSKIEFFGAESGDKVRGPRRDRLYVNEANHISFEVFEQLEVRTNDFILLDWNPTNEFWYYTDVEGKRDDLEKIILTYKDNESLNPAIVQSIEQRRNRPGWWKVYGEGLLGEVDGKIYKGWKIIDQIPDEAKKVKKWVDFGYSNDPSAIGDLYKWNGAYIIDELAFQKGLSNKQIADILQDEQTVLTIADSAEPKSIDEIKSYGIPIIGADKGADSVTHGIQVVQDQIIYVTSRSTNVIHEERNYLWMTDKNGKILNIPEHTFSHSMDGIRYAIVNDVGGTKSMAVNTHYSGSTPYTSQSARVINKTKFTHM